MKKQVPPPLLIPKSQTLARALTDNRPRSLQNMSGLAALSKSMTSLSPMTKTSTKESLRNYYIDPEAEDDEGSHSSGIATPKSIMMNSADALNSGVPGSAIPAMVTPAPISASVVVKSSAPDLRSLSYDLVSPIPSTPHVLKTVASRSFTHLEKAKSDPQLSSPTQKADAPVPAASDVADGSDAVAAGDNNNEEAEIDYQDILLAKQRIIALYKLIVTLTSNINKTKQKLLKSGMFVPLSAYQTNSSGGKDLIPATIDFDADEFDDLDDEFMDGLSTFLDDHEQRMTMYHKLTDLMKALMERVQQSIFTKSKNNSVMGSALASPATFKSRNRGDLTRSDSKTRTDEGGISKSSTKQSMSTIASHITKSNTSASLESTNLHQQQQLPSSESSTDALTLTKRNSSIRTSSSTNILSRTQHIPHSLSTLSSSSENSRATTKSKSSAGKSKATTHGTYEMSDYHDIKDIMHTTNFGNLSPVETDDEPKQESFFQDILDMYGLGNSENGGSFSGAQPDGTKKEKGK